MTTLKPETYQNNCAGFRRFLRDRGVKLTRFQNHAARYLLSCLASAPSKSASSPIRNDLPDILPALKRRIKPYGARP